MAEVMIPVRSVKGYIKEFGIEAIGKKHANPKLVKEQILDAFQKEIFGQLTMKFGEPALLACAADDVDPETKRQVDNILRNSTRKWKRLCVEFSKYRETYNLLQVDDLLNYLDNMVKDMQNVVPEEEAKELVTTAE